MTLADKFNWTIPVKDYLRDVAAVRAAMDSTSRGWDHFWSLADCEFNVALSYYLNNDTLKAQRYAGMGVRDCIEYFFGKWRSEINTDQGQRDPKWWHSNAPWLTLFFPALCWSTCVQDWSSTRRLAEYPSEVCDVDPGSTKEDKAIAIAIAFYLRDEPKGRLRECYGVIARGKKQKPKLLAGVLRALEEEDKEEFQAALETYLHYFRKSEFRKSALDKLLCFDGTTFINLGKRQGFAFKVPPEVQDHIIRL